MAFPQLVGINGMALAGLGANEDINRAALAAQMRADGCAGDISGDSAAAAKLSPAQKKELEAFFQALREAPTLADKEAVYLEFLGSVEGCTRARYFSASQGAFEMGLDYSRLDEILKQLPAEATMPMKKKLIIGGAIAGGAVLAIGITTWLLLRRK